MGYSKTKSHHSTDPAEYAICSFLFDHFKLTNIAHINPWVNYNMLQAFVFLSSMLWMFALFVMVARIVFVVDFQLIRVCVTLIERPDRPMRSFDLNESSKLQLITLGETLYGSNSSFEMERRRSARVHYMEPNPSRQSRFSVKGESQAANKETVIKSDILTGVDGGFNRQRGPMQSIFDNSIGIPKAIHKPILRNVETVLNDVSLERRNLDFPNPIAEPISPGPMDNPRQQIMKNIFARKTAHDRKMQTSKYANAGLEFYNQSSSSSSNSSVDSRDVDWRQARRRMLRHRYGQHGSPSGAQNLPTIKENETELRSGKVPLVEYDVRPKSAARHHGKVEFGQVKEIIQSMINTQAVDEGVEEHHHAKVGMASTRDKGDETLPQSSGKTDEGKRVQRSMVL